MALLRKIGHIFVTERKRNVWTRSSTTSPPPHCPCFLPPRTFIFCIYFWSHWIVLEHWHCTDIIPSRNNEIPFNSRSGHGGLCSNIIGRCICAVLASSAKQCCCQCTSSHRHCLVLFCILNDDDGNSEHRPAHPIRLRSEESAAGARRGRSVPDAVARPTQGRGGHENAPQGNVGYRHSHLPLLLCRRSARRGIDHGIPRRRRYQRQLPRSARVGPGHGRGAASGFDRFRHVVRFFEFASCLFVSSDDDILLSLLSC